MLTPVVLVLLCLIVGLGRAADAHSRLIGAVRDAARAASTASDPTAARAAASSTARADLQGAGLECQHPQIDTDTTHWQPGGHVHVRISCDLDLSNLLVSGLPGHHTLTADATVPLDTYSTYSTYATFTTSAASATGATGATGSVSLPATAPVSAVIPLLPGVFLEEGAS